MFNTLDEDGGGSIGVEELEVPLISTGLVPTRMDVRSLIDKVDLDNTGGIEFPEFLSIIKDSDGGGSNEIKEFFKNLLAGSITGKSDENKQRSRLLGKSQSDATLIRNDSNLGVSRSMAGSRSNSKGILKTHLDNSPFSKTPGTTTPLSKKGRVKLEPL